MQMAFLLCAVWLVPALSCATPIRITYSGSASGRVGGVEFADSGFVIRAVGNTVDLSHFPGQVIAAPHWSAEIALEGIGLFQFLTPTHTFVNPHSELGAVAGMSRRIPGNDLLWTGVHAELDHWDMCSSIGPLLGAGAIFLWDSADDPLITSGGRLQFSANPAAITFQVEVAPEPSAGVLLALGLMTPIRRRWSRNERRGS